MPYLDVRCHTYKMKVNYTSKLYLGFLSTILAVFLYINGTALISGNLMAILPVSIQLAVIVALITKSKYVKWFVKGWALLFIVSSGLQLLGQLLFLMADAQDKINYDTIIESLLKTIMGLSIFIFCDRTIELGNEDLTETKSEETGV
ncbi:MAG: hypothetical protein RLN90_14585 [Balneolaceae bacterium]